MDHVQKSNSNPELNILTLAEEIKRGLVDVFVSTDEAVRPKYYPAYFFSPGTTTPIGGCILQPSSGL